MTKERRIPNVRHLSYPLDSYYTVPLSFPPRCIRSSMNNTPLPHTHTSIVAPCVPGFCPYTQRRPSVILFEYSRFLHIEEELL
jgi:hypothetical protein